MKRKFNLILILAILVCILSGCTNNNSNNGEKTNITIAAAASLKNCMDDKIIPMFEEKYPNVKVEATYDSSGKLQTQIEQGADIDIFMSAAMKQMNSLNEKGLIESNSIVELLENKLVLIIPEGSKKEIKTFEDVLKADKIAIGDPESVPAGQYAKELFENLNIWNEVLEKSSLGTNVTEVLNWVSEGSADAGIVYSTDATSKDNVKIVLEAKEGTVSKVIYPVGITNNSENKEVSKNFVDFLQSDEIINIFKSYGFSANK